MTLFLPAALLSLAVVGTPSQAAPDAAAPTIASDTVQTDRAEIEELEGRVALILLVRGFDAFEALFHPDYVNWADGRTLTTREQYLAGVRRWFDQGNHATRTTMRPVSIEVFGDIALSRYRLREDFNNGQSFVGHFASLARRHEGRWLLYRTNFTTLYRGPTAEVPDALAAEFDG